MINRQNIGKFFYSTIYRKNKIIKKFNSGAVAVLMYHAIDGKNIENFKKQIHWLSNRYEFISPDTFELFLKGEKIFNKLKIMISFDDGFKSSYLATTHVLDKLNIKSIFFIPTDFIETHNQNNWKEFVSKHFFNNNINIDNLNNDYLPMSWENISELIKNQHKIGAHSLSHTSFGNIIDNKILYNEIYKPKSIFLEKINFNVNSIAFPFGSINDINVEALKIIDEHYNFCYSAIRGTNLNDANKLTILRQAINPSDDPAYIGFIIEGGLNFIYNKNRSMLSNILKKSRE